VTKQTRTKQPAKGKGPKLPAVVSLDKLVLNDEERGELMEITTRLRAINSDHKRNVIEFGKGLIEAKRILDHGRFQAWLGDEFDMSKRTARRWMQTAAAWGDADPVLLERVDLAAIYLLSSNGVPQEARDTALERARTGQRVTVKAANAIAKSHGLDDLRALDAAAEKAEAERETRETRGGDEPAPAPVPRVEAPTIEGEAKDVAVHPPAGAGGESGHGGHSEEPTPGPAAGGPSPGPSMFGDDSDLDDDTPASPADTALLLDWLRLSRRVVEAFGGYGKRAARALAATEHEVRHILEDLDAVDTFAMKLADVARQAVNQGEAKGTAPFDRNPAPAASMVASAEGGGESSARERAEVGTAPAETDQTQSLELVDEQADNQVTEVVGTTAADEEAGDPDGTREPAPARGFRERAEELLAGEAKGALVWVTAGGVEYAICPHQGPRGSLVYSVYGPNSRGEPIPFLRSRLSHEVQAKVNELRGAVEPRAKAA
jgi:hypothetical protein